MNRRRVARPDLDAKTQGVKLIFELTNLCNFSCIHCIRDEAGPTQYLPLEIVEKVLTEVTPYHNVTFVAFTGGEPTLHPHFTDLIKLVTAHGYAFGFVTNGWNFQNIFANIAPFQEYIGNVSLSLDGATEATHDALRRRPGSFRRLLQAISLCTFKGIPVHINMVVTKANRAELEAMARSGVESPATATS
jgi:MoaA/NifB/PqqE/SkfB family radical SAM enzyme